MGESDAETFGARDFGYDNRYGTDSDFSARSGDSASWDNLNGLGKVRKKRKTRQSKPISLTRRSLALIIILCVVVSGAFGLGGAALGNMLFNDSSSQTGGGSVKTTGYNLADATGSNMTVQQITEKTKSSVVEIKTESVASDSWMQQYVTQGAGSGVITVSYTHLCFCICRI